MNLIW